MLDRGAFAFLGLGDAFTQLPQGRPLGLARGHDRIAGKRVRDRGCQPVLEAGGKIGMPATGGFHQHIPGRGCGERIAGAVDMAKDEVQRHARDQFKARQLPEVACCILPSRFSAAAGDGTAAKAVTETSGLGKSFRLAAVITPSVPSLPMKTCFRS